MRVQRLLVCQRGQLVQTVCHDKLDQQMWIHQLTELNAAMKTIPSPSIPYFCRVAWTIAEISSEDRPCMTTQLNCL